jgi:hypothetical protein
LEEEATQLNDNADKLRDEYTDLDALENDVLADPELAETFVSTF